MRPSHMKPRTGMMLVLLFISSTTMSSSSTSLGSATESLERIRFHIAAIEESLGTRNTISEATVEGAPGTDFSVNLQASRFRMNARFLTDLVSPETIRIRATLDTRRFYGYSEKNVPLYEEDSQSQTLELAFDEQIVLLPFGSAGSGQQLKVLITPSMTGEPARLPSGMLRALTIDIVEPSQGGVIGIRASKIPHNFEVEAMLVENGRVVAHGTRNCPLEDVREIPLQPDEHASPEVIENPLVVNLTIDGYERSRPSDEASLSFDAHRISRQNDDERQPVALRWAGIAGLGSAINYDLSDHYLKATEKKYELRFRIKLAAGESAD
jgi:hypothetical protein